ncbi:hypothetical protein GCM10010178_61930 [Lentzea flava]|uniref:GspL cytoplasmic actin-ATPase-like domain-containing protein n=2 Tax=Lentzea flava TaxID=103732 RepID=A0ABQ2UZ72_9PSEU|nr:hypothetical protein [Lentzea flava]GGU61273.1 hypothetical protein GCM10010178_61930 [Lentzea flava]
MIHVHWADVVPGTPWWAGPVTRERPRIVYWQPLSDLVERRVNAEVDTSAWGRDVLVELTVPSRLVPDIAVMPGFAVVQLALADALNSSRDVELVVAALEDAVHAAVERVARRLDVTYQRVKAEPKSLEHPLRLSTLAGRFGGTIALVSPRASSDEFMASLPAEEVRWEGHEGWRIVRVTKESPGRPVSDVDFSAVDIPVVLDNLSADVGNALIVVGKELERLTGWLPTGLAGRVSVMGRDDGCWWAAVG